MLAPLRTVPSALSALSLVLVACGPSPEQARPTPAAEPVKSDTPVTPPPPSTPPPSTAPQLSTQPAASAVPDPPWFSPALLPKATVTKKGRSPADDQGRFTSNLLFNLPAGATLEDCTKPLGEALAKLVPTVSREEKDGRVTLSGDTAEQHIIAICGEAKGTMSAFVSYRWTQPPPR